MATVAIARASSPAVHFLIWFKSSCAMIRCVARVRDMLIEKQRGNDCNSTAYEGVRNWNANVCYSDTKNRSLASRDQCQIQALQTWWYSQTSRCSRTVCERPLNSHLTWSATFSAWSETFSWISSAYCVCRMLKLESMTILAKGVMYCVNNSGPKTDPWRTPNSHS